MRKFLIALVTKSTYVLFGVLYVVYLAYTVFPLMDLVVEFVTPLSWFIKVPAFIAFGVLSTAIALVGALPLFWMDRVTNSFKAVRNEANGSSERSDK